MLCNKKRTNEIKDSLVGWERGIRDSFRGVSWGMGVGHVAPEAYAGGVIALVHEGDFITIDAHQLLLQLHVDDTELTRRRAKWQQPAPRYTRGVLAKFARNAASASQGAVLDKVE